jgi:two-component sensor histidine kinase
MNTASSWTRPGWRLLGAEKQMDSAVHECQSLTQQNIEFLEKISGDLSILADLSRADILMYCLLAPGRAVLVSQARPHSMLPIHSESVLGREVTTADEPHVMRALLEGRHSSGQRRLGAEEAYAFQEVYPLSENDGQVLAAICIETNLIEHERHRRRSRVFRKALKQLQEMVMSGALSGADLLAPFVEHDGIMVVDMQHRVRYVSGIATNLYRKLGYVGNLLSEHIDDLELDDNRLVFEALERGRCYEAELKIHDRIWVKKAIPLYSSQRGLRRLLRQTKSEKPMRLEGVLVAIHDETEIRWREEELQVKMAMIKEVHHRVKNNMQTIASLLRLQARRAESEEVRRALQEGINRIMSVAVIHEFLAHQEARVINIRDVSQRIITQIREGVVDEEKGIRLDLRGPNIYLPTQPATVCALVVNELLLNALEHGYSRQEGGTVTVRLNDDGERITISVDDDGVGLPEEFNLAQTDSLGLQIVQTLAQGDLKGNFELHGRDKGVSAVVTFPKHSQGGR